MIATDTPTRPFSLTCEAMYASMAARSNCAGARAGGDSAPTIATTVSQINDGASNRGNIEYLQGRLGRLSGGLGRKCRSLSLSRQLARRLLSARKVASNCAG